VQHEQAILGRLEEIERRAGARVDLQQVERAAVHKKIRTVRPTSGTAATIISMERVSASSTSRAISAGRMAPP